MADRDVVALAPTKIHPQKQQYEKHRGDIENVRGYAVLI